MLSRVARGLLSFPYQVLTHPVLLPIVALAPGAYPWVRDSWVPGIFAPLTGDLVVKDSSADHIHLT